jgi:arginyl-tRNA synthetase
MGLEEVLRERLEQALESLIFEGYLPAEDARVAKYSVEPPRKGGSGHVATNLALVLGKPTGKNPRELGQRLADELRRAPAVTGVEVAGPGFLNVTFAPSAFHTVLEEVLREGTGYGRGRAATGQRINVEFVSANPTGPLLVSHGRGAVLGDAVARLLEAVGHRVTREYYINDFGNQVRLLGQSVAAAARGEEPPEGGYGGFYVRELADWMKSHRAELLEAGREAELERQSVLLMLSGIPGSESLGIRPMLRAVGIEFDVWTSEEGLHRWGKVSQSLADLEQRGRLSHGDDGALFFVTGDEDAKDRVVRRSNGATTYFASDIAYHEDKYARGFDYLLNLWGADHHGYVARLASAIDALGLPAKSFEVLLFQLVKLVRDGKEVRMGKRLGNLITLQEVVEEIDQAVGNPRAGSDALRVFYLARRYDTPIVLDLELAKKQEAENPVFYMQYGYARLCSILARAKERHGLAAPRPRAEWLGKLVHPLELDLLARLGRFPALISEAAEAREPHRIVGYVNELAQAFQSYYTQTGREDPILPKASQSTESWDWDKTRARLAWVEAIRVVYRSALDLLGVTAPERMVRAADDEDDGGKAVQS